MYICKDCGEVFETTSYYVNNEYYGAEERLACCPFCKGSVVRAEQCQQCGEWVADTTSGLCPKCELEIQQKTNEFYKTLTDAEVTYLCETGYIGGR